MKNDPQIHIFGPVIGVHFGPAAEMNTNNDKLGKNRCEW
jgi:hypothetical protein